MKPYLTGHVGSYELYDLWEWLQTPEKKRKPAVTNWTSGFVRQLASLIEQYYKQKETPKKVKYTDIFLQKPYMY